MASHLVRSIGTPELGYGLVTVFCELSLLPMINHLAFWADIVNLTPTRLDENQ